VIGTSPAAKARTLAAISTAPVPAPKLPKKLFGAVTGGDVANALAAAGFEVDRRAVGLPGPVKALGTVSATVRLAPEISVTVQVEVVPES